MNCFGGCFRARRAARRKAEIADEHVAELSKMLSVEHFIDLANAAEAKMQTVMDEIKHARLVMNDGARLEEFLDDVKSIRDRLYELGDDGLYGDFDNILHAHRTIERAKETAEELKLKFKKYQGSV